MSYKHERLDSMVGDDLRRRAIHEEKVGLENIWAELEATIAPLHAIAEALEAKIMIDLGYNVPEDYKQKLFNRIREGDSIMKEIV